MAPATQEELTLTVEQDSIPAETISQSGVELSGGIMLEKPSANLTRPLGSTGTGVSWVLAAVFIVFVAVCLRYRKNNKYFVILLKDITENRERHNAFDDTLRETSFLWLLNLLWCVSAGVLLYGVIAGNGEDLLFSRLDVTRLAICIGIGVAYTLFLSVSYSVVGNLFSDGAKAALWVKGYLSTQGLEAVILFPMALVALCVPGLMNSMIILGIIVFFLAKILFIYKGLCIFFSQIASWVLFLYYLCSLEIVPIVLAYVATSYLCGLV